MAHLRNRLMRRATAALIALGAFAIALVAWNYAPPRAVPTPVFQLDRQLRM